jgi:hypothetical protein
MTEETQACPDEQTSQKQSVLASLTRRGFLGTATVGAAAVGVMSSVPGISLMSDSQEVDPGEVPAASMAEPLFVQVRDFSAGEMSIMSGLKEVVVRDPQLVMRLLKALTP